MHDRPTAGPIVSDPGFVDELRAALLRVEYTTAGVGRILPAVRFGLREQDVPVYDRELPRGDVLATIVRLFLLGLPVAEVEVAAALAPLEPGRLQDAGLVVIDGGRVAAITQLLCVEDLLLFGDRDEAMLRDPGWVSASSPTAQLLGFLTVPGRVGSALDVGCGSGMHSLLAARRSDSVTAVDVNPRALAFTSFNARLNGVRQIECRRGDWFEPVRGEQFDVIVSNPPFVISPDSTHVFRDSAFPGDDVCRWVVTQAAGHLREGGFGHVMCNWAVHDRQSWDEAPRRWVAGTGCDALVLHFGTEVPLPYAALWNAPMRAHDPAGFEAALDRWGAYYSRLGISALCAGAVVLRRRTAAENWVRVLSLRRLPDDPAGEDILRLFRGEEPSGANPDALQRATLRLADEHEVRQVLRHDGAAYESQRCTLVRPSGLGLEVEVDPEALQVVLRLDGSRSLVDVVRDVAAELGFEEQALLANVTSAARDLIRSGFVVP